MFDILQLVVPHSRHSSLKKSCPPMSDMLQLVVDAYHNELEPDLVVT